MFTLAANMAALGFQVTNGQARSTSTVHQDKQAAASRNADRKAMGYLAWDEANRR